MSKSEKRKRNKERREANKLLREARRREKQNVADSFQKLAENFELSSLPKASQLLQLEKVAGIVVDIGAPYTRDYWRQLRVIAALCRQEALELPLILWDTKDQLLTNTAVSPLRDSLKLYQVLDLPTEPSRPATGKMAKPTPEPKVKEDQNDQIKRFYRSYHWRAARYQALLKSEGRCGACKRNDLPLHVDHIKPLRKNWGLRLDLDNLQVLCAECNHGKGNWDETDWRAPPPKPKIKRIRL